MDSRQPFQNLTQSIYSLLGSKRDATSSWADSVCEIVNKLSSKETLTAETVNSTDGSHSDPGAVILKIKDELATLAACINQLNTQRKLVLNEFLDLKGYIRVYCRLRPTTHIENSSESEIVEAVDSSSVLLKFAQNKSKLYTFDKVFHPSSSQEEVFLEIEPVIKSVLDGYNACIFAYGQTGAGKTFTMEGTPDNPGIVPCSMESLFKQADESNQAFRFGFSMLEIYMGKLKDLLIPPSTNTAVLPPHLAIQADPKGGIQIDNLVTIQVSDFEQTLDLYKLGCQFRSTAATDSNISSSRSHCMIRISMTCPDAPERKRETNKLWMVDLGGSERLLKTKAWGIRLEEGKAINLSLSALGDVISALQRKKRHIPYRNSKLTRILKDSLGEDSKTLMLVHISPKEEDLCETVCSLNFATRVRSIHLANEESAEARYQKEVAMSNLQQKIKQIEDERHDVRREIEKLNKRLENLTRAPSSSVEPEDNSQLTIEVPQSTKNDVNNRTADVKAAPLSQLLPRFMRPTFCSRKKFGTESGTSEDRSIPIPTRWRRASSHRVDSRNVRMKVISECNSECSISKFSCNTKRSADCETEYSQETSEYDIKTDIFPIHEVPLRSSSHQKVDLSDNVSNINKRTLKVNSKKFLKVDKWLRLHKNEHGTSSHPHKSNGVHDILMPENKIRHGEKTAEMFHSRKNNKYGRTKEKVAHHDKTEKLTELGAAESSISKMVTETAPATLKDLFDEDSSSTYPSHSVDDRIVTQKQGCVESFLNEDNECSLFSSLHMYRDGFSNQDHYRENETSAMQVVADDGTDVLSSKSSCSHIPLSNIENKVDGIEGSGPYISISEQEPNDEQVPIQMTREDNENEVLQTSSQQLQEKTRHSLPRITSPDSADKNDFTTVLQEPQRNIQNPGRCGLISQKVKSLCASVLLGFGFQNFGLDHDFFYGLML